MGSKKGNQVAVTPDGLRLALLIPLPAHHFYLQNRQPTPDLIIFFLRKREREREEKARIVHKGSSHHCSLFFFLKHLRVISLTLQQMYYSFCLSPISRLRLLQENDTQFSREVIDQARRKRIWAS